MVNEPTMGFSCWFDSRFSVRGRCGCYWETTSFDRCGRRTSDFDAGLDVRVIAGGKTELRIAYAGISVKKPTFALRSAQEGKLERFGAF